ncbi:SDR family oxidoreductase [Pedobacter sp. KR3-3]|uniref:SDR family oxidoreductase n=1 Tax=Pedobacter albus TaxID=3113905 RepID=A0ABU7IBJ9_9SPHI|nr:SDR family oxidoreductase [Pedobacter sp. KR3-3]MEE1946843.1 SDR family oxidoreductase [Pedobacter sp. KR3-3]
MDLNRIEQGRFLITGGAGFIGSNLVAFLMQNNAKKVRVLDNLSTGFFHNIAEYVGKPNFEFIEGDIRNLDDCQSACKDIDYVSHQAALGSVPRSIKDPITTNDVNISGFLNMLIAVRDSNVKRLVYAASSSTYGDSASLPKVEDIIGMPLSPYAVTKYVNELYAHVFALNYGIETIGLRYFNVYGPKQNPNGAYAAVIPLFISKIIKGEPPIINGDGSIGRDFTFVSNAVQANLLSLFVEDEKAINQIYNVACAQRTTLNELWDTLKEITGKNIEPIYGPQRPGDVLQSLADISKASSLLGYIPKDPVEVGLVKTYDWYKMNTPT